MASPWCFTAFCFPAACTSLLPFPYCALLVSPFLGFDQPALPQTTTAWTASMNRRCLFPLGEKTKLEDVLKQPLPKVPRGPSLTAHWLAIEGIQPSVAENPSASELRLHRSATHSSTSPGDLRPLCTPYYRPLPAVCPSDKRRKIERPDISSTEDGIVIKPIGSHILTEELQLYFKKLVGHLRGDVRELQLAVLRSVASDGGISPLLPYITNFIAEEVSWGRWSAAANALPLTSCCVCLLVRGDCCCCCCCCCCCDLRLPPI